MHPNDRRRGFVSRSVVVGDNPYHAPMRDSLRTFLDNIPTLVVIAYHNCNTCIFIRHLEYISHQHYLITKPSDIRLDIVLYINQKAVGIVHIGQTIKKGLFYRYIPTWSPCLLMFRLPKLSSHGCHQQKLKVKKKLSDAVARHFSIEFSGF